MSRAEVEERLARHKAAFARRDVAALAAEHAPDGTFESPAYGVVQGRDAIRDVYRYWYEAFPDFVLTWDYALVDPPRASCFWSFDGTAAGPFFGQVQRGSRVHMIGAAEYLFSSAGIVSVRHVFDFSGVLIRAGVLKIKPT
jgi:predicted ester cyclase